MKKIICFLVIILTIPSIFAASYEQTAADISPGVFAEGEFYFPSSANVIIGDDADPGLSSPVSLYITDGSNDVPLYVTTGTSTGIYALNTGSGTAVYGYSEEGRGIYGKTDSTSTSIAAVYGYAAEGAPAIYGYDASGSGIGVKAYSGKYGFYTSGADYGLYIPDADSYGVYVASSDSYGGKFKGDTYGVYGDGGAVGLYGMSDMIGVYGVTDSSSSYQCGVVGYNSDSGNLGYVGCPSYGLYTPDDAKVAGELIVEDGCSGCDIAEHFLAENLEPGDVVVLDPTKFRGVKTTTTPYSKLAAGIVSTDPTIIMGIEEGVPIALSGVVPTKVIGKIKLGDLLTTSSTAGYAMACTDYQKCQGAIIGKAMEENTGGKGTITALVMLG
ncbi:MAG: hypothetical protein AABX82_04760 [Nanoarchaeota archaeon]